MIFESFSEAFALRSLFGGSLLSLLGFAEEALPLTDALPTATAAWVLQTLFAESPLAQLLGIEPLELKREEKKEVKEGVKEVEKGGKETKREAKEKK